ncbi:MAG: GtrA family protein [Patescibacteria group bacterium]|nr:GtrA family protein [bacterium]MDZ4240737.1 GtrA family protein [Patescibacteria group bacterium]
MKFLIDQFRDFRVVFKYGVSGCIAAGSQVGMLALFVEVFGISYLVGVVWAFIFSAFVSFGFQKFWTFKDHSLHRVHFQMIQYVFLAGGMLALNVAFMYFFVDIVHIWYIVAQILTIGITAVVSFLFNKIFIFSREEVQPIPYNEKE